MAKLNISFVCLGNICRSPMAEGIFKHLAEQAGLADHFHIESAGIGGWHAGEPADFRAQATARAHGLALTNRAQQIRRADFARLDILIALDIAVAEELRRMAPTPADRAKVHLLREYDPLVSDSTRAASEAIDLDVPDPYYGGREVFEDAYQMIERSSRGLLESLAPKK
jgi:protein-tyrosine phosphatase